MNDSDDLFGGLPAVANAENAHATTAPSTNVDLPAPVPSDVENSSAAAAEKRKGGASLISSLGSAGTAMVSSIELDVFIDRCSLFESKIFPIITYRRRSFRTQSGKRRR